MACKCFFYIPIPVLPPLPIALPVGGARSLPAWLAGAATVSAALPGVTAWLRQPGRTAPAHPAAALRAARRRGCRGCFRGVRWPSDHQQPVTAFHQADGGKWDVVVEVGSRWCWRLSRCLTLNRSRLALLLTLLWRCIVALADQVDAVHPQLQIRLALMLACGQLPAHGDLLALLEIPRERSLGLLSPNATVNPDGLLLVPIACGHRHGESANSRASGLPYFCVATQVASQ